MLTPMIDTHAKKGSTTRRGRMVWALSRQVGQKEQAIGTGRHRSSTRVEIIPGSTQHPAHPIEGESTILHCCHGIPVGTVCGTVEVRAALLVSAGFRAELHELRSGTKCQLDGARDKQTGAKCCGCCISSPCRHWQPCGQAKCFSGSCREPTGDSSRWDDWWKQATFQVEGRDDFICPTIRLQVVE